MPGVYTDWTVAQEQIRGFSRPRYRKFSTREEAEEFVNAGNEGASASLDFGVPGLTDETPKDAAGVEYAPGEGPLPTGAEDGFDPNVLLDPTTGKMVYKPVAKKTATKTRVAGIPGMLRIYTDGSSLRNGTKLASAGVGVYFGPGDSRFVGSSLVFLSPRTRTNLLEERSKERRTRRRGRYRRETFPMESRFRGLTLLSTSRNVSEPLKGSRQTNQRAELTAILRAIDIAPRHRDVTIYTDSRYAIDCVTVWFVNWRRNNWMTKDNKPVENRDLVEAILVKIEERNELKVKTLFQWIKGHNRDPGNEAADQLAVNGAHEGVRQKAEALEVSRRAPAAALGEDFF